MKPARARVASLARPPIATDPSRAVHLAEVLKAVAHPLRLRIIALLVEGDERVGAMAERLGASQAIVSQQLRILRGHGLVAADREGGGATYRLVERNLEGLVTCMEKCSR
ncbi:MAG: winged helix-turn-helix transcriptional regulator [Anaeromyxobacter sp.]|nr:winged helix-turn-helix transcriptional regulator [Anaeromyxobacter sp.]MBL0275969.1 winged helix-turn-helix transcriptional regulator [Anaeromyxobacter sp.]